jgi:hypothetical protein
MATFSEADVLQLKETLRTKKNTVPVPCHLLLQVRGEFRRFAVSNYLSTYYMHTLNIETGMLLLLLLQVRGEFRRFAVSNYLSTYYMHTLNIETGLLGHPPPPRHWRQVAALLQAR